MYRADVAQRYSRVAVQPYVWPSCTYIRPSLAGLRAQNCFGSLRSCTVKTGASKVGFTGSMFLLGTKIHPTVPELCLPVRDWRSRNT